MDAFIGEIRPFAGNYAPQNWALCDGTILPVNGNEALFSLLGATYGGNGQSNFALPDLRGRVIIKDGTGTGLSTYAIGNQGGLEGVTIAENNLAPHTHSFLVSNLPGATNVGTNGVMAAMVDTANPANTVKSYLPDGGSNKLVPLNETMIGYNQGGNDPHENRMPFITITYMICTVGEYPMFQ